MQIISLDEAKYIVGLKHRSSFFIKDCIFREFFYKSEKYDTIMFDLSKYNERLYTVSQIVNFAHDIYFFMKSILKSDTIIIKELECSQSVENMIRNNLMFNLYERRLTVSNIEKEFISKGFVYLCRLVKAKQYKMTTSRLKEWELEDE